MPAPKCVNLLRRCGRWVALRPEAGDDHRDETADDDGLGPEEGRVVEQRADGRCSGRGVVGVEGVVRDRTARQRDGQVLRRDAAACREGEVAAGGGRRPERQVLGGRDAADSAGSPRGATRTRRISSRPAASRRWTEASMSTRSGAELPALYTVSRRRLHHLASDPARHRNRPRRNSPWPLSPPAWARRPAASPASTWPTPPAWAPPGCTWAWRRSPPWHWRQPQATCIAPERGVTEAWAFP